MKNTEWKSKGLCYGHPQPDIWFPGEEDGKRTTAHQARRICNQCPVQQECREYAIEMDERHGVWGSVNRNTNRPKTADVPPRHGTEARARRHRRLGEKPCEWRLEGEREARAARRPA